MWILVFIGVMLLSGVTTYFTSIILMKKYIEKNVNYDDNLIEMAMSQFGGKISNKQKEKIKKQLNAGQQQKQSQNKKKETKKRK